MKKVLSRMQGRWPIAIGCLAAFICGAILFVLGFFILSPPTNHFTAPFDDKAFIEIGSIVAFIFGGILVFLSTFIPSPPITRFIPPSGNRSYIAIGCLGAIVLGGIIIAVSAYAGYSTLSTTTSSFTSPSGNKSFIVMAGCDGIPCTNSAALVTRSETEETKWQTCDLRFQWDSIHFENTVVDWSDDEQTVYWKFGDQDSSIEIDVENDCQ